MSWGARLAVLALAALLAACGTFKAELDPQTAQLERFKQLGGIRQYAAIAAQEVRCDPADEACRQLHLIKGDACFELARRGDEPLTRYDCAIEELGTGLEPTVHAKAPPPSAIPFTEKLMEALRVRRDLSASKAESERFTTPLLSRARGFRAAYPEHPAGYYYEASGLYGRLLERLVTRGPEDADCAEMEAILELLQTGGPEHGRYAANFAHMTRDVQATREAECPP